MNMIEPRTSCSSLLSVVMRLAVTRRGGLKPTSSANCSRSFHQSAPPRHSPGKTRYISIGKLLWQTDIDSTHPTRLCEFLSPLLVFRCCRRHWNTARHHPKDKHFKCTVVWVIHDSNCFSLLGLIGRSRSVYLEHTVGFSQNSLLVWREIYHTVGTRAEKKIHISKLYRQQTQQVKHQTKKKKWEFLHDNVKWVLFQTRFGQGLDEALDKVHIGPLVAKLLHVIVHIFPGHFELEDATEINCIITFPLTISSTSTGATLWRWSAVPGYQSCRSQWHDPSPPPADSACSNLSHFHCPGPEPGSPPTTRAPPDRSHSTWGLRHSINIVIWGHKHRKHHPSDLASTSGCTLFSTWRMEADRGLAGVTHALVFRSEEFFRTRP